MKFQQHWLISYRSPPLSLLIISHYKLSQMKKFLFICSVLLTFTLTTYSQITKGNWLVGGNGRFQSSKTYYQQGQLKLTSINISPNIGYFIHDKIAGGLRLNYSYSKGGSLNPPYSKYSSWKIGPFARYYFFKNENRVNLIADAGVSWNINSDNGDKSRHGYEYNFMTGPVIFFNSAVGIECLAGYQRGRFDAINYDIFLFTIGLQIHLEKE